MSEAFLKVVNMSISAGWLVLAVLALRLVLKKAPKWVNVLLWGIVAIRLICPFSIESALSLIPSRETISPEIMMDWTPEISTGIAPLDRVVNPVISTSFAPQGMASANPLQILIPVAANLWLLGVLILLAYTAISYLTLRNKLRTAVILRDNIFQCETVSSPFVLGILKPRIYLPYNMNGQNLHHVVAHEQAHIERKDHWWKPLGFLLLTVYWFNPLMWVAYILLCRDIELACDEKVIAELGNEQRADYTQALVACAVNRRIIAACPLAFGEVGVKDRIKSIMNYRKPTFWIIVTALVVCIVVAVCFLTDPNPSREFSMNGNNVSGLDPEAIVERILDIENWESSNVYTNSMNFSLHVDSNFNWMDSQTISYFFSNAKTTYGAQLRIFPEEGKYFLTEPTEMQAQNRIFLLRHYLEAIKYLPQDEIMQMAPADQYLISHIDGGSPSDYQRVIRYSSYGIEETDGWFIHLQIQPLHWDGEGYQGTGEEVIEVFYGDAFNMTEILNQISFGVYDLDGENTDVTEIKLRNLHNGKDTMIQDAEAIEAIMAFLAQVQGANAKSSKGFYGGCYELSLLSGSEKIFSIGFGDDESFNYGDYGDGYPTRYDLRGVTREEVVHFFSRFDSSGFDWGISSYKFRARILEVHEGYFLVEPVEGSWELSSASQIEVPITNMSPSPEPQVGDILQIEYDGMIQETYPARLNKVYHLALEQTRYYSSGMIPTDTELLGFHAGALLVPIDGKVYRYELSEGNPEGLTVDELLYTFTEETHIEGIVWEVHSLKEYPDKTAVLMISGTNGAWLCSYSPPQRCSATALADAIHANCVIMEDGLATQGQDTWEIFYNLTLEGKTASVAVAHYHTLDPERCDKAYYEVFSQDYPALVVYQLAFDGNSYTLSFRDRDGDSVQAKKYEHLMRYDNTEFYSQSSKTPGRRFDYVLTHDNNVTWEKLFNGLVSSQMGAYIDHHSIYSEIVQ